jgi:hypothetical protein
MKGRDIALILFAALCCVTSWLLGYHQGQQTGAFHLMREMDRTFTLDVKNARDMDRDEICDEIRDYKLSIARDLDENTQICGWPDMDGREKSN